MSTNVDQQRTTRPFVLSALFSVAWLCASPSHASVTGEWADGASRGQSFARVLVVGVSPDIDQRCGFERAMASKIKSADTVAIVSCDVMPLNAELTRESVEAAVAANNADAVLATSLIAVAWDVKEGGTRDDRGAAYYRASDLYYGVYGTVVTGDFRVAESLTTLQGTAQVTSKLYETRGATVVYTVNTKVRRIESRAQGLAEITPAIGKKLRKDGLIR